MYSLLRQPNIGMLGAQEPSSGDVQWLTVSKNFQKKEESKGEAAHLRQPFLELDFWCATIP